MIQKFTTTELVTNYKTNEDENDLQNYFFSDILVFIWITLAIIVCILFICSICVACKCCPCSSKHSAAITTTTPNSQSLDQSDISRRDADAVMIIPTHKIPRYTKDRADFPTIVSPDSGVGRGLNRFQATNNEIDTLQSSSKQYEFSTISLNSSSINKQAPARVHRRDIRRDKRKSSLKGRIKSSYHSTKPAIMVDNNAKITADMFLNENALRSKKEILLFKAPSFTE